MSRWSWASLSSSGFPCEPGGFPGTRLWGLSPAPRGALCTPRREGKHCCRGKYICCRKCICPGKCIQCGKCICRGKCICAGLWSSLCGGGESESQPCFPPASPFGQVHGFWQLLVPVWPQFRASWSVGLPHGRAPSPAELWVLPQLWGRPTQAQIWAKWSKPN